MNSLQQHLPVKDIRGRTVGNASALLSCCVQLGEKGVAIRRDAVLSVGQFGVELICDGDQLGRYACEVHTGAPTGK